MTITFRAPPDLRPINEREQAEKNARCAIRIGHERFDACEAELIKWAQGIALTACEYPIGQEHFADLIRAIMDDMRARIVQPLEVAVESRKRIDEIQSKLDAPPVGAIWGRQGAAPAPRVTEDFFISVPVDKPRRSAPSVSPAGTGGVPDLIREAIEDGIAHLQRVKREAAE